MSPSTVRTRRTAAAATRRAGRAKARSPTARHAGRTAAAAPAQLSEVLATFSRLPDMTVLQRASFVEKPMPARALEAARQATGASVEEFQKAMAMTPATWKRRVSRNAPLALQESESLVRIANLQALAQRVIGKGAMEWLREPHPYLDGQTPLAACRTEPGGRAVEEMLYAIEAGVGP